MVECCTFINSVTAASVSKHVLLRACTALTSPKQFLIKESFGKAAAAKGTYTVPHNHLFGGTFWKVYRFATTKKI